MNNWIRVTKNRKCPVCRRPDWCLLAKDGTAAICPRVPSDHDLGEAGYVHKLDRPIPQGDWSRGPVVPKHKLIDFDGIASEAVKRFADLELAPKLSEELGVSQYALVTFFAGWSDRHHAYTFPMFDGNERIVGVRLRSEDGRKKWAITGSKSGLFIGAWTITTNNHLPAELYVCEGPTDAMALFDMGLFAVGRPSCLGGVEYVIQLLRNTQRKDVVIVADNDPPKLVNGRTFRPGRNGADALAQRIRGLCRSLKVIEPYKAKDIRAMSRFGEGRQQVEQLVRSAPEWRPL